MVSMHHASRALGFDLYHIKQIKEHATTREENGMDYTVPVCDMKKRTVYSRAEKKGKDK